MAVKEAVLYETAAIPSGSLQSIYAPETGETAIIDKISFLNTTSTNQMVNIHIAPAGEAFSTSNRLVFQHTLGQYEAWTAPEITGHVLEAGDFFGVFITSSVGGSHVTLRISGRIIT